MGASKTEHTALARRRWLWGLWFGVGLFALAGVLFFAAPILSLAWSDAVIDSKPAPTPAELRAPMHALQVSIVLALVLGAIGVGLFLVSLSKIRRLQALEREARAETWTG